MTLEISFVISRDRTPYEPAIAPILENCFQYQQAMIGMASGKAKSTPAAGASYERNLHRRF
uniref:hypothetical protein n=1 Tax=Trichocoleus desertorum TaxID=1481672 RepID=UPI0025B2C7B7|nr:hypothetical protein [Trichocoleus desertorum]